MPEGKKIEIKPAKGRPMLTWVGKRPLSHVTAFPAQHVETFSPSHSELRTLGQLAQRLSQRRPPVPRRQQGSPRPSPRQRLSRQGSPR